MDLDTAIHERRSIRGFKRDEPVPRAVLEEALALAQRAPSNCNVQPWRVFIASGACRERLEDALVQAVQSGEGSSQLVDDFEGEYRQRQVACAVELYRAMGVAREDKAGRQRALLRNYQFFDAPHVAIVCMEQSFGMAVALDVGAYLQTLMLALQARGVSSCPQVSLCRLPEILREHLSIPSQLRVLCGLSFGYADPSVPANRARQSRGAISDNVVFCDG